MEVGVSSLWVKKERENAPFEPMRPRDALVRSSIDSRKKLESRYRAKINSSSQQHLSPSTGVLAKNAEKDRAHREEKEEWMLELQDIYDRIHEELVKLIKTQSQPTQKLSSNESAKFKDMLDKQMADTEAMINRLIQPGKQSLQSSREGILIANQFRASLKDLYEQMETVGVIQMQKDLLNGFQFMGKLRQIRSQQLLKEISNSAQRKDKVKLGNSLRPIIEQQQQNYEQDKLTERLKNVEEFNKLKKKYPFDDNITLKEPAFFTNGDKQRAEIEKLIQQRKQELSAPLNLQDPLVEFKHKKQTLEMLANKMVHFDGPNVDFDSKYRNIGVYFEERRSLNELYLGETRLGNFLADFEKKCAEIDQKRRRLNDDEITTSEESSFVQEKKRAKAASPLIQAETEPFSKPTSNRLNGQTASSKVSKINADIEAKLNEEENEQKLQQIKRLSVEQNQEYWSQLLERQSPKGIGSSPTKKKASTSHGQRSREGMYRTFSDRQKMGAISPRGEAREDDGIYITDFGVSLPQRVGSPGYLFDAGQIQQQQHQVKLQQQKEAWLEKQRRLVLNSHSNNAILSIALSNNPFTKSSCATNFATEPVSTNNQFLVRRRNEFSKTSQVAKRSQLVNRSSSNNFLQSPQSSSGQKNLNQVKDGDCAFRETFFSNFFLFQPTEKSEGGGEGRTEAKQINSQQMDGMKKQKDNTNIASWKIKYPSTATLTNNVNQRQRKIFVV